MQTCEKLDKAERKREGYRLQKQYYSEPEGASQLDDYATWTQEGNRLMLAKCDEEAIAAYDRALKLKPNCAYSWLQRGEGLKRLGRLAEANTAYQKAVEYSANPISRYQALNAWGALLFELQLYEEAIAAYNQSLAIFPHGMGSPHILKLKGMAMSKLRRYDEAVELFNQAYDKALEVCAKL